MNAINVDISIVNKQLEKKRILILISEGGGGHKIAGDSLKEILTPYYDVEIVNVMTEIVYPLDLLHKITSGNVTGEDFYNFLLRKGYHKAVNVFATLGNNYLIAKREKVEVLFEKYLRKQTPHFDLVISTVPFVNSGLASASQKLEIPFIIMPTDLDTATFFIGLSFVDWKKGGKFAFALPYDDQELRIKGLKNLSLPEEFFAITGFPVRPECQRKYSEEEIRQFKLKHNMSLDCTTLTLLLGAAGGEMLLNYTQELMKLDPKDFIHPLEINVCVGRNIKIGKRIIKWLEAFDAKQIKATSHCMSLKTPSGLLFHVRGYTREIVEIMAASKLIITKTGSCSVNEAIYLGKKLFLDNTEKSSARYLFWESFNVPFVRKHGLGDAFANIQELPSLIKIYLKEELGHPVVSGAFPVPNFEENILALVERMMKR